MNRRSFLASAAAACGSFASGSAWSLTQPAPKPDPHVKRVLVMFKCHFDAGFMNTQQAIVNRYFQDYFPKAILVAEEMRRTGPCGYVWTTGSWLLYEYLEQATPAQRRQMEAAIARGDIAWHALPFNWQTELLDASQISASIGLSKALDRRFGRTTTGAKMTDVPGHTRGLIAPLAQQGVTFLDIGVNSGSTPAQAPMFFLWKNSNGSTLTMMYHHNYGAVASVPGADVAVAIVVRNDNSGPHTPQQITEIYGQLKQQYPNAEVIPTNLTEIANAVAPHSHGFPVITEEVGDTWIYGVASDPLKLARYREVSRLREGWIQQGKLEAGGAVDLAMLRHLLLEPEHTWGVDVKKWLDYEYYTPQQLASMLHTKNYEVVQYSWEEKRKDLLDGIATLPPVLRREAEERVHALAAREPALVKSTVLRPGEAVDAAHFTLHLDAKTGAITGLRNKHTGYEWASPDHPLVLLSYQTLSQDDYTQYRQTYLAKDTSWTKKDFGKPNIQDFGAKHQEWYSTATDIRWQEDELAHRVLARLTIEDPTALDSGRAAFPGRMYLELVLPKREPVVQASFYWFDKPATRLPEALWLSFHPVVSSQRGWFLRKVGERISPFDVLPGGGRHMHSVSSGFGYDGPEGSFFVETLDAPVVALGGKSPLNFSLAQPDLSGGVHSNLFNNAWGTNYVMWYGEDMRFRFILHA